MANSSIAIVWTDGSANTTDVYTHELSDANYDRILTYFRNLYPAPDDPLDPGSPWSPASKNKARKTATKDTIQKWKDLAREAEAIVAAKDAVANVPPIDSTDVTP